MKYYPLNEETLVEGDTVVSLYTPEEIASIGDEYLGDWGLGEVEQDGIARIDPHGCQVQRFDLNKEELPVIVTLANEAIGDEEEPLRQYALRMIASTYVDPFGISYERSEGDVTLKKAINMLLDRGGHLVIKSFSQLGRGGINQLLRDYTGQFHIHALKDNVHTDSACGRLVVDMFKLFNEYTNPNS